MGLSSKFSILTGFFLIAAAVIAYAMKQKETAYSSSDRPTPSSSIVAQNPSANLTSLATAALSQPKIKPEASVAASESPATCVQFQGDLLEQDVDDFLRHMSRADYETVFEDRCRYTDRYNKEFKDFVAKCRTEETRRRGGCWESTVALRLAIIEDLYKDKKLDEIDDPAVVANKYAGAAKRFFEGDVKQLEFMKEAAERLYILTPGVPEVIQMSIGTLALTGPEALSDEATWEMISSRMQRWQEMTPEPTKEADEFSLALGFQREAALILRSGREPVPADFTSTKDSAAAFSRAHPEAGFGQYILGMLAYAAGDLAAAKAYAAKALALEPTREGFRRTAEQLAPLQAGGTLPKGVFQSTLVFPLALQRRGVIP